MPKFLGLTITVEEADKVIKAYTTDLEDVPTLVKVEERLLSGVETRVRKMEDNKTRNEMRRSIFKLR